MKTIGLIGGMSWESTVIYYRLLNEGVKARLGGLHSAKILLSSVDFAKIAELQRTGAWEEAGRVLADHARRLQAAGAEGLLIGANTMHKVSPAIAAAISIPLLHVADATAEAVRKAGGKRPALLGTRFTMEQAFYRERLEARGDLAVLVPNAEDRASVHRVIYEELCVGKVLPESRAEFRRIIAALVADGADSVIFGCTEIPLLVSAADSTVPIFDTTAIHAAAAVEWMLGGE